MAHGSRKAMGLGSATSLTQKWFFVERHKASFVGSCSHRGRGSDSQNMFEELGEARVWRPEEKGAFALVT